MQSNHTEVKSTQAEMGVLMTTLTATKEVVSRLEELAGTKRVKRQALKQSVDEIKQSLKAMTKQCHKIVSHLERRRPSDDRESITHKFSVGGHEGYVTVGKYDDGSPAELFITMSKQGSTIGGLMDSFASMTSLALQYGVPLETMVDKFTHTRFEPSGFTKNPEIPMAKSIMDYIFKWMALKFLSREEVAQAGLIHHEVVRSSEAQPEEQREEYPRTMYEGSPSCSDCGSIMVRNGMAYKCINCGATSGVS